ncbi:MAG TPA: DUF192 domain-containing protein [Actinomycetota bacterium]|nr:DUF192 domain-containing protein [Actinomycetota bacterium]
MRRVAVGARTVWVPERRRERVRGLRGRPALPRAEGLLLERCRSVHTFGMRFAIDAVVLDRRHRVVAVIAMRPRRLLRPRRRGRHVLEVAAGAGREWSLVILPGLPRTSLGPHRLEA